MKPRIKKNISQIDILSADPVSLIRREILEIRRSRESAASAGSWTAVGSLHRLETDLLLRLREAEAAVVADDNGVEGLDHEGLVDLVVEAVASMNPGDLARVRAALDSASGLRLVN